MVLEGLEDVPRSGQPAAALTSGTAAEVAFVATDRQKPLKLMVHKLCINGEMIRHILHGRSGNEKNPGTLLFDHVVSKPTLNPLNAELNPIRHLLALVGARHIVHVSRIRVKYGSQAWIFSAQDGETYIGSAHVTSETNK